MICAQQGETKCCRSFRDGCADERQLEIATLAERLYDVGRAKRSADR